MRCRRPAPSTAPTGAASTETCSITSPVAGRYFILLYGASEYASVNLVATFVVSVPSPGTLALNLGREWEACSVKIFNELQGRQVRDHRGTFLSVQNGTPFEVWITEMCDFLQRYEQERYRLTHPVTTVNWPTLDPLDHPSESTYGDASAPASKEDQAGCERVPIEDAESLDLAKIRANSGSGFFALYQVYPYYPDFMNNDYADRENPYLAYLTALKSPTGDSRS